MMGLAAALSLCSESDTFVAASFVQFGPSAMLGFLVFGPMVDLKLAALYDQWSQAQELVDEGYVPERTPFVVWFVALALGPIVEHLQLFTR